MSFDGVPRRAFVGVSALVFAVSVAVTSVWSASMSAMGGMSMPGGWTMSMTWMRMPGTTWPVAAASFVTMWSVMMVAMMLPSVLPVWWSRYATMMLGHVRHSGMRTIVAATGYVAVWAASGLAVFIVGAAVADAVMRQPALARSVPFVQSAIVVLAGAWQLTAWKARHLATCHRLLMIEPSVPRWGEDWRTGTRLGVRCAACCANLMVAVVAVGAMDLRAMGAAAVCISAERLTANGARTARGIGIAMLIGGLVLTARALRLG